jgi:hypothetical protein
MYRRSMALISLFAHAVFATAKESSAQMRRALQNPSVAEAFLGDVERRAANRWWRKKGKSNCARAAQRRDKLRTKRARKQRLQGRARRA